MRIANFLIMMVIIPTMILTDTLAISHLIILSCKFENLRGFFKSLRKDFMSQEVSISELKQKCLDGVIMHQKLISIKDKLHNCFGVMISIEVLQGSFVVVLLLLRVALSPQITVNLIMMNGGFMLTIMTQLAWYMWNAGDITHQASLISDAIFHCGWHLRGVSDAGCGAAGAGYEAGAGRDVRRLVLLGCAQAQRPLVLKAFGMQDVSYQSYVMVCVVSIYEVPST
ncbi:hypothetical protein JYU34_014511 [Plutella xylostella]|uniref:Odorant receptor n=1 Tax=Plutella xylostella TaxID=51655 RepID=A0ABQ7Q9W4_PLUXY|nr:hypothetical protein JYU34_014511 [Plutella xylostella]